VILGTVNLVAAAAGAVLGNTSGAGAACSKAGGGTTVLPPAAAALGDLGPFFFLRSRCFAAPIFNPRLVSRFDSRFDKVTLKAIGDCAVLDEDVLDVSSGGGGGGGGVVPCFLPFLHCPVFTSSKSRTDLGGLLGRTTSPRSCCMTEATSFQTREQTTIKST